MKKIILILFCLWAFPVVASHIVGGEFEIVHISGNNYRVNLILYFDELNGNIGARDENVNARIFRKRDNVLMREVFLSLSTETPVAYTQPACSKGYIVTTRILYSSIVQLTPQQFSDAMGYYLAWERCCRNYSITNIYSDNPLSGGQYAGLTFYLEFPPVEVNGKPFINSSPRLFPPLNDYACPNRPYYVDFAGVDDDGDSLVYSLVTPLNTKTADALPLPDLRPRPRPYPEVIYRAPFNATNVLGGRPDLRISADGFLTVTPSNVGLFVFAVRCDEYRDGIKIGELRRDFQMLVVNGCNPAEPPQILGKKLTDPTFGFDTKMNVTFSNAVPDAGRCIQIEVSDPDALRQSDNFTEQITIKAIPLNFKKDVSAILPAIKSATLVNGSTSKFDICFERCPYLNGPFQIAIIAYDDACSLPLSDTLKVTVTIEPPANTKPYFTTPNVTEMVNEGTRKTWPITARDNDQDLLILGVITDGFILQDFGMEVQFIEQTNGLYRSQLVWDTHCDVYNFRYRTSFEIKVLVEDMDACNYKDPATMIFKLNINLPGNASPVISTDLSPDEIRNGISRKVFETLSFNVFGKDRDNDNLKLTGQGNIFDLSTYSMTFPEASSRGWVTSQFNWNVACEKLNLAEKDIFELMFIVVDDANKCRLYKADTLIVKVKVEPPENAAPVLTIASTNPDLPFINNQQTLNVGEQISLGLAGTDADLLPPDHIVIEMIDAQGSVDPTGYIFERVEGQRNIQTTFTWNTDCSIFQDGVYENTYTFKFRTYDDRCFQAKADTVAVEFIIKDVENRLDEFMPPNFITPDNDVNQLNEFFGMVKLNPQTGQLDNILPKDNCVGYFVGVTIYNRWGKQVFESTSRDFRWVPDREASGIYFYTLTYSDKEFKGSVTIRN